MATRHEILGVTEMASSGEIQDAHQYLNVLLFQITSLLCAYCFFISDADAALSAHEVYLKSSPSVVVVLALDARGNRIGSGSGVVVDKQRVVTNWHVVENADTLVVRRKDTNYKSQLIADRRDRDLAILAVPGLDTPSATLSSAKSLRVGQAVFALGAPAGLELTLTSGIVSGMRDVENGQIIQTSAAISPGSSGGGLFDDQGQLIGITTLKLAGPGQEGLNFALPSDWVGHLLNPDSPRLSSGSTSLAMGGGLIMVIALFMFGKPLVRIVTNRFSNFEIPAQKIKTLEKSVSEQKDLSKLPAELVKYSLKAQQEYEHGQVDTFAMKQAQEFCCNDQGKTKMFYMRLRSQQIFEQESHGTYIDNAVHPRSVIQESSDSAERVGVVTTNAIRMTTLWKMLFALLGILLLLLIYIISSASR